MSVARQGDTVKVYYTARTKEGELYAATDRRPLEITIGETEMIPGFVRALMEMEPGESRTVEIPADDAYGQYNNDLVLEVDKNRLPQGSEPQIGQQIRIPQPGGGNALVRIADLTDSSIILDANHPMAGRDLIFDIQLVEIEEPQSEEQPEAEAQPSE